MWGLFQSGIALFLSMKKNHHHLFFIDIPWPRENESLHSAELSQNKHLLDSYVLQTFKFVCDGVDTIYLLRAVT